MAWVCSTFDEISKPSKNFRSKDLNKVSKKKSLDLWVEGLGPSSVEDLAVHKKKIHEVQTWLFESRNAKTKKIALLTGPPGSAKSTTVRILSKELGIEVKQWNNSVETSKFEANSYNFTNERGMNQIERFSDFIFRSSKYRNVCAPKSSSSSVVLVEEFPQSILMSPMSFHSILRSYQNTGKSPIVFVVSDSNNNHKSFLKSLFPSELQKELSIINIQFNPISATLLLSALNRVLSLSGEANSPFFESLSMPKKEFLQGLADKSGGDVRNAINALQFTMMRRDDSETASLSIFPKSKRKKRKAEDDPTMLMGGKDSSLQLFRALGKVLYCKRTAEDESSMVSLPLPQNLAHHRRKVLVEDPEDVFERSEAEASSFNLFLHHNCLSFFQDVSDYYEAVTCLQDADILDAFWEPSNQLKTYAASVSVRGLMHHIKEKPKGSQHVFRSLNSPAWFSAYKTTKERLETARRLCLGSTVNRQEMVGVLVPYLAKIHSSSGVQCDILLREIGLMYPVPKIAESSSSGSSSNQMNSSLHELGAEEEDDFIIEEIED